MIRLTVDGKEIDAEQGMTLLQACLDHGIYIPHLCYLRESSEPHASCRLCFVEIDGKLAPSCTVQVRAGMAVKTDAAEVRELQNSAFRLLMSVHKVDCAHCRANKKCELQRISRFLKVGLKPSGLQNYFKEPELVQEHPAIDYYPNRCVLCARCVRVCLSGNGRPAMTFAGRGFDTVVSFYGTEKSGSSCENCHSCIDICPVGALALRSR